MIAAASVSVTLGEGLARRFDDTDPSHVDALTKDEGITGTSRLRGGALRFDEDGCSVFRTEMIALLCLPLACITTPSHPAVALTTRGAVEAFRSGLNMEALSLPEFLVRADPLEPGEAFLPAHSLIYEAGTYPSKTKRRAARGDLAGAVFTLQEK